MSANPTPTPEITVKLYTLGGAFGMRNVSPFCLKLELLLTFYGIEFENIIEPDPRKAPKGKLPYVEINGRVLADSELIVYHLDELTQGRFTSALSPQQNAHGIALTRLAEEHLYWMIVASRWLDDAWWPNVVKGFFDIAPWPLNHLVAKIARRQVRQTYHLQGLGRHSDAEQHALAHKNFKALNDSLDPAGFLFGNQPTLYDFGITGILAGIYDQTPPTWINKIAEDYPDLRDYADRVQATVGVYGRAEDSSS